MGIVVTFKQAITIIIIAAVLDATSLYFTVFHDVVKKSKFKVFLALNILFAVISCYLFNILYAKVPTVDEIGAEFVISAINADFEAVYEFPDDGSNDISCYNARLSDETLMNNYLLKGSKIELTLIPKETNIISESDGHLNNFEEDSCVTEEQALTDILPKTYNVSENSNYTDVSNNVPHITEEPAPHIVLSETYDVYDSLYYNIEPDDEFHIIEEPIPATGLIPNSEDNVSDFNDVLVEEKMSYSPFVDLENLDLQIVDYVYAASSIGKYISGHYKFSRELYDSEIEELYFSISVQDSDGICINSSSLCSHAGYSDHWHETASGLEYYYRDENDGLGDFFIELPDLPSGYYSFTLHQYINGILFTDSVFFNI